MPREVAKAEKQLLRLSGALRRPIGGLSREQGLVLALGQRGWNLYRGFWHALSGPSLHAAHVDLRSILDVTILVRWIEEDPPLHVLLWLAEDQRQRISGMGAMIELAKRRGQPEPEPFPAAEETAMRTEIAEARAAAKAAGLPITKAGRVLPGIDQMAQRIDHLWEIYNIAYRQLSPSAHAGGRSFAGAEFERRPDGIHLRHRPPFDAVALRSLAVPTVLMLFASVSRQCGLGIEAECDAIRMAVVLEDARAV